MAGQSRDPHAAREAVALLIACLVSIVWAITYMASVFFNRPFDPAVHGLMLAVVTAVLGTAGVSAYLGRKNGNGNGKNGASH